MDQTMLPRSRIKQQKQNHCTSKQTMQRSVWPDATTNQQFQGSNLSSEIIGNSLYNFIPVDCYLVASFLNLVNNTPAPSYPTDISQINQVEPKLNSDFTRYFYPFLLLLKSIGQMPWLMKTKIDRR
jgi:hypothetical protein